MSIVRIALAETGTPNWVLILCYLAIPGALVVLALEIRAVREVVPVSVFERLPARAADDPFERELVDKLREGKRLRRRFRSNEPPPASRAGAWAVEVIELLEAHGEAGYVDRFHGSAEDQVHPPHDAAAQADYLDGRLRELRQIINSVRGRA